MDNFKLWYVGWRQDTNDTPHYHYYTVCSQTGVLQNSYLCTLSLRPDVHAQLQPGWEDVFRKPTSQAQGISPPAAQGGWARLEQHDGSPANCSTHNASLQHGSYRRGPIQVRDRIKCGVWDQINVRPMWEWKCGVVRRYANEWLLFVSVLWFSNKQNKISLTGSSCVVLLVYAAQSQWRWTRSWQQWFWPACPATQWSRVLHRLTRGQVCTHLATTQSINGPCCFSRCSAELLALQNPPQIL